MRDRRGGNPQKRQTTNRTKTLCFRRSFFRRSAVFAACTRSAAAVVSSPRKRHMPHASGGADKPLLPSGRVWLRLVTFKFRVVRSSCTCPHSGSVSLALA